MEFTCHGCGRRFPGCHAECKTYQREKAEHDARRAHEAHRRGIVGGLQAQRAAAVYKATRHKRKDKNYGTE